jgi:hypothetical protein
MPSDAALIRYLRGRIEIFNGGGERFVHSTGHAVPLVHAVPLSYSVPPVPPPPCGVLLFPVRARPSNSINGALMPFPEGRPGERRG